MEKLEKLRKFSKAAKLVASHCKMRDAAGVLEEINKLEPKLEKFAGN